MSRFELAKHLAAKFSLDQLLALCKDAGREYLFVLQLAVAIKMEYPTYE